MISICFICTGNTCRSIMAERLFKRELKLRGLESIKVSSKGIHATQENIAENAKKILKKYGAVATNRKSIQLKKVNPTTLYVTMSTRQKEMIDAKKVISYEDLIGHEVQDPYGLDISVYEQTAAQLYKGVVVLIEKILKWEKST